LARIQPDRAAELCHRLCCLESDRITVETQGAAKSLRFSRCAIAVMRIHPTVVNAADVNLSMRTSDNVEMGGQRIPIIVQAVNDGATLPPNFHDFAPPSFCLL
jgi:hypothetical protein